MTNTDNFENFHFHSALNYINRMPDSYKVHWHKYVEILALPADDDGTNPPHIRINQNDYILSPGDIIFIWPGELHEPVANASRLYGLQFSLSHIQDLPEFAPFMYRFRLFQHMKHTEYPELTSFFLKHIELIRDLQQSGSSFTGVEALIHLYIIFVQFGSYLMDNDMSLANSSKPGKKSVQKIDAVCNFIADNCEKDFSLDSLSEQIGFSTCYFSRLFKNVTGYNFVEYVTLQRVKRAQELLAESGMSITDISYQAGFKSISTFNRVFKQYKGCAPTEYRKYYTK